MAASFETAIKGMRAAAGGGNPLLVVTADKGEWGRFEYQGSRPGKFGPVHSGVMLAGTFKIDARVPEIGGKPGAGKTVDFFGCGRIDNALKGLKNGSEFVLRYLGERKITQKGHPQKGKPAHSFEVYLE